MNLFGVLQDAYPTLLKGLFTTVEVTVISLLIATVLGIITCMFRISHIPPLRWLAKFYIWLIRGTPMLVQAMYIYLALPQLLQMITGSNVKISIMSASIATLALNAGAYMSEIFRGAIEAVDKGQTEAARSLGLSYGQTMRKVVLPQAVRICLPSLVNQCCQDLSAFAGQPVHHHLKGQHDPLRDRSRGDHVLRQSVCGADLCSVCHLHLDRGILPGGHLHSVYYLQKDRRQIEGQEEAQR